MLRSLSACLKPWLPFSSLWPEKAQHLHLDSRRVRQGDVFVAIKGTASDGTLHIASAIAQGAVAVLKDGNTAKTTLESGVPVISLPDLKAKLPAIASTFYGNPASSLALIGVTGTNGKTSCTHFLAEALSKRGEVCGLIGTLGVGFYGKLIETGLTTPDVCSLQASLRDLVDGGAKVVAMEVSSHSIDQGRVAGLSFETVVFTNLTQDHLDYHGNMDAYAAVKYRLLSEWPNKHCVINVEDAYGSAFAKQLAASHRVQAYAVNRPVDFPESIPLTYTESIELSLEGIRARVLSPFGEGVLHLPLIGAFNLSNVLAVLVTLCLRGLSFDEVLDCLSTLTPVPGRMQTLAQPGRPLVVVDYAHTPDALDKVLSALRQHTEGRLICVFGCGGDRDPLKRPLMAAVAERWADQVIVTNDNPRHEAAEAIASGIMGGFQRPLQIWVELDRSKAIEKSIQYARLGDCVLIAGKGAERYQQIGDEKHPFDDVHEALHILRGL